MTADQIADLLTDVLELLIESADVNEGYADVADLRDHIEIVRKRIQNARKEQ